MQRLIVFAFALMPLLAALTPAPAWSQGQGLLQRPMLGQGNGQAPLVAPNQQQPLLGPVQQPPQVVGPQQPQMPPLPPQDAAAYYATENGVAVGPLTLAQMGQRIQAGTLQRTGLVWRQGVANWMPAQDMPEIAALFTTQPGPPPVPQASQFQQLLIGTWELSMERGGLAMTTTMSFRPDGTYSGYIMSRMMNVEVPGIEVPASTQTIQGTWTVAGIDQTRFTLTTQDQQYGPSSSVLRVIDAGTVLNESVGAQARRIQ